MPPYWPTFCEAGLGRGGISAGAIGLGEDVGLEHGSAANVEEEIGREDVGVAAAEVIGVIVGDVGADGSGDGAGVVDPHLRDAAEAEVLLALVVVDADLIGVVVVDLRTSVDEVETRGLIGDGVCRRVVGLDVGEHDRVDHGRRDLQAGCAGGLKIVDGSDGIAVGVAFELLDGAGATAADGGVGVVELVLVEGEGGAGEVAGEFLRGRNESLGKTGFGVAPAFIAAVEEEFFAEDGTTDSAAELILRIVKWRGGSVGVAVRAAADGVAEIGVAVAGIEDVVADELPDGAVKVVGAGFGEHVDDAAGDDTKLCAVDVGLNLELLHGVDDGEEAVDGAAEVGVDDAVHVVESFAVLLTEEGDLEECGTGDGADSCVGGADTGTLRGGDGIDAGRRNEQRGEVAAVERELLDLLGLDDAAKIGGGVLEHDSFLLGGDFDGLGDLAYGEGLVFGEGLVDEEDEALKLDGAEAGFGDGEVVRAGSDVEEVVVAGSVGGGAAGDAGVLIGEGDGGALDDVA